MDDTRFRLRMRYCKAERVRYLSHLELVRCLERCIRRAGLPFMVSQGFSPHMRTAFGWALPVGVASQDEYLDVLLSSYVPPQQVMQAFEGAMPRGLRILDVCYVDPKAPSLVEQFPFSDYECVLGCADGIEALPVVDAALEHVLQVGQMVVHRKKKDKVVRFEGLLVGRPELTTGDDGAVIMNMTTFTKGEGSLRPDLFCAEITTADPRVSVLSITRLRQRAE